MRLVKGTVFPGSEFFNQWVAASDPARLNQINNVGQVPTAPAYSL